MRPSRVLALGMIAASALGVFALGACGRMLEIQPDLPPDGGPWVRPVGGAVVFDTVPHMAVANAVPQSPIDQLADGGPVDENTTVWTGAHATLVLANIDQTCNDWKSPAPSDQGIIGTPASVMPTANWIEKGQGNTVPCAIAYPILCFEQ